MTPASEPNERQCPHGYVYGDCAKCEPQASVREAALREAAAICQRKADSAYRCTNTFLGDHMEESAQAILELIGQAAHPAPDPPSGEAALAVTEAEVHQALADYSVMRIHSAIEIITKRFNALLAAKRSAG